jgi:hypothetical protein
MSSIKELFYESKLKFRIWIENKNEEYDNLLLELGLLYVNDICNIKKNIAKYICIYTNHDYTVIILDNNFISCRPIMGGYDIEDIVVHLLDGEYFRDVEIFNEDYIVKFSVNTSAYHIIHKEDFYKTMNKRSLQRELNKFYKN